MASWRIGYENSASTYHIYIFLQRVKAHMKALFVTGIMMSVKKYYLTNLIHCGIS